jgi:oxygen-independent coproporphyrinogen-3 oxidase
MGDLMNQHAGGNVGAPAPWIWPRAAYVHVPFCAHHCGYCDFAVVAGKDDVIDLYLEALERELSLGSRTPITTLFLGGGTPTHPAPAQLERLLRSVRRWLPLESGGEFSVEANPDTLTVEKVAVLAAHGVNRVSLGAQSFRSATLQALERAHRPEEIGKAVERVRQAGIEQLSLDLIFGAPGQTLADWQRDLEQALALAPDHISTYGLTYEKGTPLWKARRAGAVKPVTEDDELEMYQSAIDTLEKAGFEHYEISSFARPGCQCRHNQVYWANHAYFGFGMGAARYVRLRREVNTRDLHGYLRKVLAGEPATFQAEELEPRERARETMAVQLRRAEGIAREQFQEQTGFALEVVASGAVTGLVTQGFLEDDGQSVRLTRAGKYVADAVIERLL